MSETIQRVVFGTLLSLSIYGLVNSFVDWGSEKSPWDTQKVKRIVLLIIMITAICGLFYHNKKKTHRKKKALLVKASVLGGSRTINPSNIQV